MTNPTFIHNMPEPVANPQVAISANHGPLIILNKNGKAAQEDPDNPYEVASGVDARADNVVIVRNQNYPLLNLYLLVESVHTPTQSCIVRAYGLIPLPPESAPNPDGYFRTMKEAGGTNTDHYTDPELANVDSSVPRGYWVPLLRPTDGAHDLDFGLTPEVFMNGTPLDLRIYHNNAFVYCGNVDYVMVLVSQGYVPTSTVVQVGGQFYG